MTDHPATALPAPRAAGELLSIQYLRGIAAAIVVIFHLEPQLRRMAYEGAWVPGLSGGVDIFFVISGFIMWVTTCGRPISPLTFWRRRIARIVPLYWLFTAFMTVMMVAAPTLLQTSRFDLSHIVKSFFFIAAYHPVKNTIEPVVMPGWTLNYEMFFYAIFGIFLLFPTRARFVGTLITLISLVAVGTLAGFPWLSIPGFYTSSIMLEFAMGMALGYIVTKGDIFNRLPKRLGLAMLVFGLFLVIIIQSDLPRVWTRGIPAMALVAGALILEAHGVVRKIPLLHAVGNASYSIYLSQIITLSFVSQAWRKIHIGNGPLSWALFCITATVAAIGVGYIVYQVIEKPLTSLTRRRRSGARIQSEQHPLADPVGQQV